MNRVRRHVPVTRGMGDPGITPWLMVALRVVSNPCSNALQKALVSRGWPAPVLLAFTHGMLGPVAIPILLRAGDSLGWHFWSWSLLSAALAVAANWLIIEALRRSDLSLLGPINAYKPWVSLLPGWLLLGERPVGWEWVGMVLVLSGSLMLGGSGGRVVFRGPCSSIVGSNFGSWPWFFRRPRR